MCDIYSYPRPISILSMLGLGSQVQFTGTVWKTPTFKKYVYLSESGPRYSGPLTGCGGLAHAWDVPCNTT